MDLCLSKFKYQIALIIRFKVSQENPTQAKQWLNKALDIQNLVLPEEHKDLLATINLLKSL